MLVQTIFVVFHGKQPVFSLDFVDPTTLVTSGADKEVKLWKARVAEGKTTLGESRLLGPSPGAASLGVAHLASLAGHSGAVNCVRSSPDGRSLASAGDGGELLLWDRTLADLAGASSSDGGGGGESAFTDAGDQPYRRTAVLRGHGDDVMALAWSADGRALASGSVDARVVIWEASSPAAPALAAISAALPPLVRPPPPSAPSPAALLSLARPVFLSGHRSLVQGLAWDPRGRFLVSQSADRTCRVWGRRGKGGTVSLATLARGTLGAQAEGARGAAGGAKEGTDNSPSLDAGAGKDAPLPGLPGGEIVDAERRARDAAPGLAASPPPFAGGSAAAAAPLAPSAPGTPPLAPPPRASPLFADESLLSFFRRPAWSPDGHLLALPAGIAVARGAAGPARAAAATAQAPPAAVSNAVHVYATGHWEAPALTLRGLPRPALAVAWCPIRFRLPAGGAAASERATPPMGLPYALVLACATSDGVVLLSTAHEGPLLALGALHLDTITDVAWAPDGRTLAVSSLDGFCSVARFDPGELGDPYADGDADGDVEAAVTEQGGGAPGAFAVPQQRGGAPGAFAVPQQRGGAPGAFAVPQQRGGAPGAFAVPQQRGALNPPATEQGRKALDPLATEQDRGALGPAAASTEALSQTPKASVAPAMLPPSSMPRQTRKRITPEPIATSSAAAPSTVFSSPATAPPASQPAFSPPRAAAADATTRVSSTSSPPPSTTPKRRRVVPTPVGPGEAIRSMSGFDRPSAVSPTAASFSASIATARREGDGGGCAKDAGAGPLPTAGVAEAASRRSFAPRDESSSQQVPSPAPSFSFDTAGLRSETTSPVLGANKEQGKTEADPAPEIVDLVASSPAKPAFGGIAAFAMAAGKQAAREAKR